MNERQILEKSIDEHKAAVAKAEGDLEKLSKPELRHGDYWYSNPGDPRLFIGGEVYGISGSRGMRGRELEIITGNLVDDLKRNKVDLTGFSFDVHTCHFDLSGKMAHAPVHIAGNWHTLDEAIEIHQKLGQMISTIQRRKGK